MKILKDRALLCPDCGSKFFSLQKCLRYVEEQSDYQQQKQQKQQTTKVSQVIEERSDYQQQRKIGTFFQPRPQTAHWSKRVGVYKVQGRSH